MAKKMTIKVLGCLLTVMILMSAIPVSALAVNDSDNTTDLSNSLNVLNETPLRNVFMNNSKGCSNLSINETSKTHFYQESSPNVIVLAQGKEVRFQGEILADWLWISFYSFDIKIDKVLDDPTGNLQKGETVNVYGHRDGPAQVDDVTVGDKVEVFGEYRGYVGTYEQIYLSDFGESSSDHYVKKTEKKKPDIIIKDISWSPSSPDKGDTIKFTVKIKNQGSGSAGSSTVKYYIDGSYVGSDSVSKLSAGSTSTETFTWTASKCGDVKVKAVADANNDVYECGGKNNDRTETVSIKCPTLKPDLIIKDISWSPSSPDKGDTIKFTVKIKNQGSGSAGSSTVKYYIDGSYVGSDSVSKLSASSTSTETFTWTANKCGDVKVKAVADANKDVTETSENNNDRTETVSIKCPTLKPDLIIKDISWSPSSPDKGDTIKFTVKIRNQGSVSAGSSTVKYYIDGSHVGYDSVPAVSAGSTSTQTFTWTANKCGSLQVKAVADANNAVDPESDEGNNERTETMSVPCPTLKPDLIIQDISWSPSSPKVGDSITFTVTIKNHGSGSAGSSTVKYHTDGSYEGYDSVPALSAGSTSTQTFTWTANKCGNVQVKAVADANNAVDEGSNDGNNERTETVSITGPINKPDGELVSLLWKNETQKGFYSVDISSDGNYVAAGSSDNNLYFFDKAGKQKWKEPLGDRVNHVAISGDGNYVAAGSGDSVYYLDRNKNLLWKNETAERISSVSVSDNGDYVAFTSYDGYVYYFDQTGFIWRNKTINVPNAVSISGEGKYLAVGCYEWVYYFNRTGFVWKYEIDELEPQEISISSDGEYIAIAGGWGISCYLDKNKNILWEFDPEYCGNSIKVSSDGEYVVLGSGSWGGGNGWVYYFSKPSNTPIWEEKTTHCVATVDISSNGDFVIAGSHPTFTLYYFNNQGESLFDYPIVVNSARISSDGKYVVAASDGVYFFGPGDHEPQTPFTFVHLTDPHIGYYTRPSSMVISIEKFTDTLQAVKTHSPEFILNTGDIVEYSNRDFFKAYAELIKSIGIPVYHTPGNHDRRPFYDLNNYRNIVGPVNGPIKFWIARDDYYFDWEGYRFIGLDSGHDHSCTSPTGTPEGSGLEDYQYTRLLKSDMKDYPRKIIFMHHPVINDEDDAFPNDADSKVVDNNCPWHGGNDMCIAFNRCDFIDYCTDKKVDLVLTGHTHKDYVKTIPNDAGTHETWFIQTRSATDDPDPFNYHGYRVIKITDDGVIPHMSEITASYKKHVATLTKGDCIIGNPNCRDPNLIWGISAYRDNQHTGMDYVGNIERQIPDSYYTGHYDEPPSWTIPQVLVVYGAKPEEIILHPTLQTKPSALSHTIQASSTYSPFNFSIRHHTEDKIIEYRYDNVGLTDDSTASVDLTSPVPDYTMEVDYYGDGSEIKKIEPDSIKTIRAEFPVHNLNTGEDFATIQNAIDDPDTLDDNTITVDPGTYIEHLLIDKPLKLMGEDKNTTIIEGGGTGKCVHITADNVKISGFTIRNGTDGIWLESSNGCIMDNNIISYHCEGISLSDSNNNLIAHNSLHNNGGCISGIHLSSSHNNVIRDNDLVENVGSVSLRDSNNNLIYHNNFVDNIAQASDNTGANSWDNGPIDGGNYWSDHGCIGNPSAEPYSIDSDGVDHYPFQNPNGWAKGNQPPSSPTLYGPGTTEYTPGTYLLKTTWDRHGLYALKTPLKDPFGDPNDPDNHWSLGSWSTAIGQIINFHHLQSFGTVHYVCSEIVDAGGKKVVIDNDLNKQIYNWDNMPSRLSATSSSEEIDSVSTFIYDVATVIQRDFGTGTYPLTHSKRASALVDHFDNLDSATEIILNPPIADIEKEVSEGHPCMLHLRTKQKKYFAVVIDGYKWQNGEFQVHLNFCKGGTSDGWYDYNQEISRYDDNAYRKVFFIRLSGDDKG